MSAQKDTSKPSDRGHIRNRFHANRVTKKQITDNRSMGELSALFTICLILIAGMFNNAAIAGNRDGRMTVDVTGILEAGKTDQELAFTYTAFNDKDGDGNVDSGDTAINMNGGAIQLAIPDGWKVPLATTENDRTTVNIEVTDGDDNLVLTDTEIETEGVTPANINHIMPDSIEDTAAAKALRRVKITKNGNGNVTMIEVELHPTEWTSSRTGQDVDRAVVISLANVTVAIPPRLFYTDGTDSTPYASYQFTTQSKAKDGAFDRLKPTIDAAGDPVDPHPRLKVGNIAAGKGGVEIIAVRNRRAEIPPTIAYEGETYTFTISFTAVGPMYDLDTNGATDGFGTGGTDSEVQVSLVSGAAGFGVIDKNDDGDTTDPGETQTPQKDEDFSNVSLRTRGTVRFETGVDRIEVNNGVITVNISRMDTDDVVHISYGPITITELTAASGSNQHSPGASVFTVGTRTSGIGSVDPLDDVKGGRTQAVEGSGTATLSPDVVEAGVTGQTFTHTYKADTAFEGTLEIVTRGFVTADIDDTEDVTEGDLSTTEGEYGYVSSRDTNTSPELTPAPGSGNNSGTITWTGVKLARGASFRTTITNVNVLEETGKHSWSTTASPGNAAVAGDELVEAKDVSLYIIETEEDGVEFHSSSEASIPAASKAIITFEFTASRTPIRNGSVSFRIPRDWTRPTPTAKMAGVITAEGTEEVVFSDPDNPVGVSKSRSKWVVTIGIEEMPKTESVTVTYGAEGYEVMVPSHAGTAEISGHFQASSRSSERSAGSVEIDITNAEDGAGTARITPTSVRAGSSDSEIVATFTATGTMDGGRVLFQIPRDWGDMQRDPLERNYIRVATSRSAELTDVDYGDEIVIAILDELGPGQTVSFIYGGGTGSRTNRGAEAQNLIGTTTFTIKSDGNGDGRFQSVEGERALEGDEEEANPKGLGEVFTDAPGELKLAVTGAIDGSGTATVEIVDTKAGEQTYKDARGDDVPERRVHAGDDGTYLQFTYHPDQTIQDGQLRFTVPAGWSYPQGDNRGEPGFTSVDGTGNVVLDPEDFDGKGSMTVDIISLNRNNSLLIHYGWYAFAGDEGGAIAPGIATASSRFTIEVRGTSEEDGGRLKPIDRHHRDTDLDVRVWAQASGGGTATIELTDGREDLGSGDRNRELTIVYTAVGEVRDGALRLTLPEHWTPPMNANFDISSVGGSRGRAYFGGDYTPANLPVGLGERDVLVESLRLDEADTVKLVYKNVTVQPTAADDVVFGIAYKGSDGPGDGFIALDDLTVDVGEARAGSGMAEVSPKFVSAEATGRTLTFTYIAAGEATFPKDIRVKVPDNWSPPSDATPAPENRGTYTVAHVRDGREVSGIIQWHEPIEGHMVARVRAGSAGVMGDDQIIFTYQNANAPETPERSIFTVFFDNVEVDSLPVSVRSTEPATQLTIIDAPSTLSLDEEPVLVTITLQDSQGNAATRATSLVVTLDPGTGTFSRTVDGPAVRTVTIAADNSSAEVYYSGSTAGEARITASAPGLTGDTATITVTPHVSTIDPVAVEPTVVMDGDIVTVTVRSTSGRQATFSVGNIVPDTSMPERGTSGTYQGQFIVDVRQHRDGVYDVTVYLDNEMRVADDKLTIDNTPPSEPVVSVDMMDVKNGTEVTITATVDGATSASADVSALNARAPTVELTASADGLSYTGSFTVTARDDGSKEITVTAMDDVGNRATGAATVTLDNTAPSEPVVSVDMMVVKNGTEVTITATVDGATSASADVSALNARAPTAELTASADGLSYTSSFTVTAADDGSKEITVTAMDDVGNSATGAATVTLDNTAPSVTDSSASPMTAKNGDTVMIMATISETSTVSATVSMLDTTRLVVDLMDADGDSTYTAEFMISANNRADDGSKEITVTAADSVGNRDTESVMVTLDNTAPEVTGVLIAPSPARNGREVTITAMLSEAASVSAAVSMLDTMRTTVVDLMDADGDGTYSGSFTISEENEAESGSKEVTVTAMDAAGNSGRAAGTVDLVSTLEYTSVIPPGISLFHVPLDVTAVDGNEATLSMVSDLYDALDGVVNYLITYDGDSWNSYLGGESGDAAITADLGIVAVMRAEKTITFTGNAWGEGESMITLRSGLNLVGLPLNDARVSRVSDIMRLPEFARKVASIIVSTDEGKFVTVAAAGAPGDDAVRGDAAYLVNARVRASQSVMGEGWINGGMMGAAPVALFGHTVDNQTPALFVEGSIVDELTGLAEAGFRIKVKNLSTKAALSTISGDVAENGYNMTFVDTKAAHAARVGDVLEISADSPDPLIGVQPVRHIVTIDDVKNSRIELTDLIAYEIPAETKLLRNYPNPFNPETWIPYRLAEDADVSLTIYDVNGELVRSIDVGHQSAAVYESRAKAIYWDGRNRFGEQVASGIYFYSLSAGDFSATRKMLILK